MPPIHISKSDKDLLQETTKANATHKRSTSCITALDSFKVKRVEPEKLERLKKASSKTTLSETEHSKTQQKLLTPVEQIQGRQIDCGKSDKAEKKKAKLNASPRMKNDSVSPTKDDILASIDCSVDDVVAMETCQKKQRKQSRSHLKGQHRKLTDAEMDANHSKLMKAKQDAGKAIKVREGCSPREILIV